MCPGGGEEVFAPVWCPREWPSGKRERRPVAWGRRTVGAANGRAVHARETRRRLRRLGGAINRELMRAGQRTVGDIYWGGEEPVDRSRAR